MKFLRRDPERALTPSINKIACIGWPESPPAVAPAGWWGAGGRRRCGLKSGPTGRLPQQRCHFALPPAPSRSHPGVVPRASSRGRGSQRPAGPRASHRSDSLTPGKEVGSGGGPHREHSAVRRFGCGVKLRAMLTPGPPHSTTIPGECRTAVRTTCDSVGHQRASIRHFPEGDTSHSPGLPPLVATPGDAAQKNLNPEGIA
jgi:hypothetical protein